MTAVRSSFAMDLDGASGVDRPHAAVCKNDIQLVVEVHQSSSSSSEISTSNGSECGGNHDQTEMAVVCAGRSSHVAANLDLDEQVNAAAAAAGSCSVDSDDDGGGSESVDHVNSEKNVIKSCHCLVDPVYNDADVVNHPSTGLAGTRAAVRPEAELKIPGSRDQRPRDDHSLTEMVVVFARSAETVDVGSSSSSDERTVSEVSSLRQSRRRAFSEELIVQNYNTNSNPPSRFRAMDGDAWAAMREVIVALNGEEGIENPDQYLAAQLERLREFESPGRTIIDNDEVRPSRECQVCYDVVPLSLRSCCRQPVCDQCLGLHVETQLVAQGNLRVVCPASGCDRQIYHDEVRQLLADKHELRDRYDRWIVDLNGDPHRKTCPRCCRITELNDVVDQLSSSALSSSSAAPSKQTREHRRSNSEVTSSERNRKAAAAVTASGRFGRKVRCVECQLDWCFNCQAPWHEGISCKQYRAGDVLLKNWAHEKPHPGERNAQQCPKCKIYIQRIEGCDHMTCNRCQANFCYRCGDFRRTLTLFGFPFEDHDWKHSIIGCREKYKPDRPVQRALARGAIFSAKVIGGIVAAPVVVTLVAGVAAIALPAYGTYRLARTVRKRLDEDPVIGV